MTKTALYAENNGIINLTILECKLALWRDFLLSHNYNKSNHIGM